MLLRLRVPGKIQTRCEWPYISLHSLEKGRATLELLAHNGEVRPVAIGNIILFYGRLSIVHVALKY